MEGSVCRWTCVIMGGRRTELHGVCKRSMHAARNGGGHRESARSGDADDGEDAEVDSALPRRRYVVRDHGLLLGLGVVLLLGLGSVLDLDLERAELVVPSKDVILPNRGRAEDFSLLWAVGYLGGRDYKGRAE